MAGVYNLTWGAAVVLFPLAFFRLMGLPEPTYPQIWQCVGMIVGVYGIGYWIAARDPARHWPIVLVGLLGKVFGPIGLVIAAVQGQLPWSFGWMIIFNDVPWWIPFLAILYHAVRVGTDTTAADKLTFAEALRTVESHRGATLGELSDDGPVLVLFLRHAGCTFCREAMGDLASQRKAIEDAGVSLAIVHLDDPAHGAALARSYDLDDVHRFTDPACKLYEAFSLQRGRFLQLLGPTVALRAWPAVILGGHGFGRMRGDGFRMPGVFVLKNREIVAEYRHRTAADRPNYAALAREANARRNDPVKVAG